jgi:hypothetical protein
MSYKILLACFILYSCSAPRMMETDLYFGQSKPDGSMITDIEWKNFKENQIDKVFKEGSTVINATGSWYDPDSHKLITEPTHVVIKFYKKSSQMSQQLDSLRNRYKNMFQQQSVLRVDKKQKCLFSDRANAYCRACTIPVWEHGFNGSMRSDFTLYIFSAVVGR